jgi:hypothetical protein
MILWTFMADPQLEISKRLYFDLEKFHRIIGYYEGQKIKPLDSHEKHITTDLEKNFRGNGTEYIRLIQYDLQTDHVLYNSQKVFETDKPETSLLYLLFSEGIKSLVLLRDLTALEIRQWCLLVRETLIALDSGESKDLASVLWKTPFRNLRTRIYNSLMDLCESQKEQANKDSESQTHQTKLKSGWHERDSEWDLPSGDIVVRNAESEKTIQLEQFQNLKDLVKRSQIENKPNVLLHISSDELEMLSIEMSIYDQNHVEFNLLAWCTRNLGESFGCDPMAQQFSESCISKFAVSFIGRFHAGLILHLMKQIDLFQDIRYRAMQQKVREAITISISTRDNIRRLLDSMTDPVRAELSQKLLTFVDQKQYSMLVDFYLGRDDKAGLVLFLEMLISREMPIEELLVGWGEERLTKVLPYFKKIGWREKYAFVAKMIRSKFAPLVVECSRYIIELDIRADHALDIFRKLPPETQELWVKSFKDAPISNHWGAFMDGLAKSDYWIELPLQSRKILVEIFFKYLQGKALKILDRFVRERKMNFWAKYPEMRELILNVALDLPSNELKKIFQPIFVREMDLKFQEDNLRERLRRRVNASQ